MNISSEGREALIKIDEALSTIFECLKMLAAFDKGNGPIGFEAKELIKIIKDSKTFLDDYLDDLSIEDTEIILNKTVNLDKGQFAFGVSFNSSKEKMIILRTINELLSKYLKAQFNISEIDYPLLLSEYLTIDMVNVLINILSKVIPNYDIEMQRQLIISKYYLTFCVNSVEENQIDNNYQTTNKSYVISKTAHKFCDVSKDEEEQFINTWAEATYYNALNNILNSKGIELSVIDIVNSCIMRTILVLINEDLASDLMYNTMNYLQQKQVSKKCEEILFDAITSRFEDENIPAFVSFER